MYREHTIGVVVPAYNEEAFIGGVIADMPPYIDHIYAVDDGSTDGTWEAICEWVGTEERTEVAQAGVADGGIAVGPRVIPLRHETNRGPGAAIKTGYLEALEQGMDVVATVDGDGQMEPERLEQLLNPIVAGEAGYAKGNRLGDPESWRTMPRLRLVGNVALSFLTKLASGYWRSRDAQNGFTAISRSALEAVDVETLYEYYGYCDEVLVRLNVDDVPVADIPMPARYGDETSAIRYVEYIPRVSLMLLRNFLWRLWRKYLLGAFHPLVIAYLAGIGSVGLAGLFAIGGVVTAATGGPALPLSLASLTCLLFAGLFVVIGMIAEFGESRHLEVRAE